MAITTPKSGSDINPVAQTQTGNVSRVTDKGVADSAGNVKNVAESGAKSAGAQAGLPNAKWGDPIVAKKMPGRQMKRKVDEDDIDPRNASGEADAAQAGGAAEAAGYADAPMLLAQADTGTAGATAGGASTGGAAASATAGTGAATTAGAATAGTAAGAAAGAGISAGALAIGAVALVGVVAVASSGDDDSTSTAPAAADTTAPVLQSAAISAEGNNKIVLTYGEALDATNVPVAGNFGVTVVGAVTNPTVIAVAVSGTTVTLTLATALAAGSVVSVTYTDPTTGNDTAAVQDAAGNDAITASKGFTLAVVADGYVRGAQIYVDTNNNGVADASEKLSGVVTNATGGFVLPAGSPTGTIIATGGVNIDTGVPNAMVLKAPAGSTVVTPLTTLVQAVIASNAGTSVATAEAAVVTALGLTTGTSLTTYDPLAALAADGSDATALAVQTAAVQVATMVSLAAESANADTNATTTTTAAGATVISNLATAINTAVANTTVVNLTDAATITAAITGAVDTANLATVRTDVGAANTAIDGATTLAGITTAQATALDTVAPAAPTAALSSVSDTGTTGDNLTNDSTPVVRVSFNTSATDGTAAVVGDIVTIYDGATVVGTGTLGSACVANGYKDITLSTLSTLPGDTTHALTAKITDIAGKVSAASSSYTLTLDTAVPSAPTVALTTDSGAAGDFISNVGTVVVTGTETGATVQYSTDGGTTWGSSFTAVAGINSVQVRQVDAAGNASPVTPISMLGFTFDTVAPTLTTKAPADNATDVAVGSIVLTFNENVAVGSGNIVINGTDIAVGSGQIVFAGKTVTITPTGGFSPSTAYSVQLASGVITDVAGNAFGGVASGELNFTTSAAPAISSIAANVPQAKSGDVLTLTLTLTEEVAVDATTGTPTLVFDVGGQQMIATYSGATVATGNTMTFTAAAPITGDDATVTVATINLNGASVIGNFTTQPLSVGAVGQTVSGLVIDNSAPVFTSATTANAAENQTVAYATATTDGTAVSYALTGTDAGLFNIDSAGAVTFKTAPNREAPADNGGNNVYDVTITATDALGHATSQIVAITVTNVNEAPSLTSGATSTATLAVNQAFSNNITGLFSDVDGDTLTYSATGLPTGVALSAGVISGTPTVTGPAPVVITATDGGGLTASHTVTVNVVAAPTLSSTIDNVTNFDVTSNIVLTASESVTAVAGKYITIVNDGGTGFHGEATVNTQIIAANDTTKVTISGSTITINPGFDLDFNNNYHIMVDAGAFLGVTSGQASVVTADAAAMNFGTVNPSATSAAATSSKMSGDTIVSSYGWWDAEGNGVPGGASVARDFANGDFAIVGNDLATTGIATNDFYIAVNNFAAGDLIYVDNHGANAVQRQSDFNNGLIIDMGSAPTQVITGASGTTTGLNGGQFDVTLASSTASFTDTTALKVLLGNVTYEPILYG